MKNHTDLILDLIYRMVTIFIFDANHQLFVLRLILKTSSVTPDLFYVFNLSLSVSTCRQTFKKICAWEVFGRERF